jgi:hypothetical protein
MLATATGCHSRWVDATIENRTGHPIRGLEVDYPQASFGTNSLAEGASMHYRFQIRGEGPVKLEYATEDGKTVNTQGLALSERQQGQLLIRLRPAGEVQFVPKLEPAS